jgi:predicted enzyme related to lactoylglutathione lyase
MQGALVPPTLGNGKICYVEIPAISVEKSAAFYKRVFDWNVRTRDDGHIAFDDAVGQVSGTWVLGRAPSTLPGLLLYIMVDDAEETVKAIAANGGEIVGPIGGDAPEITARFRDSGGNVIGIYQEPTARK